MRFVALPFVLTFGLTIVGCGGDEEAADDTCTTESGTKAFAEACSAACECASGVCHPFGDGTTACTQGCTTDGDCPSGSQGQKCNAQGVCRT